MTIVSVVVPATNQPSALPLCLEAIAASKRPPDEVIVVDDAWITSPAAARNLGVARARGDVIVFVDADVVVHDDALGRFRDAFGEDPSLDAIFGSYDDDPPMPDAVSGFRNLLHHHVHQAAGGTAATFWAGLGAVRRSAFVAVGGFVDHPVEDIELGMRLHASGARIRLDPAIQGSHLKRWSIGSMLATDLLVRGAPWVRLLLRHRSTGAGLNLGWRHRLSALASLVLVVAAVLAAAAEVLTPVAIALFAFAALLVLNLSFYRLLVRRRGLGQAAAGVALHIAHHLVAIAALVIGVAQYVVGGPREDAVDLPVESRPA